MKAWIAVGALVGLLWLEGRRPLRRRADRTLPRQVRNLLLAGLSGAVVGGLEQPLVQPLARRAARRRWGLARLPPWLEVPLTMAAMDYTMYLWHILTHRVPILWRFHLVHHTDLDLDVTTALRFHFGEMLLSIPWRAGQVSLLGVAPRSLTLWQSLFFLSVLFHHSNLRLPARWEALLAHLIVTPRLDGVHHSSVAHERDSNWSSGLTLWDRLHGTLRTDASQADIRIGVEGWTHSAVLVEMVMMPLRPRAGAKPTGPADPHPPPQRPARTRGPGRFDTLSTEGLP